MVALVVEQGEQVLARFDVEGNLMLAVAGLAQETIVQMPIDRRVGIGVRGPEDQFLPFAGEPPGQIDRRVVLRIDQVDRLAAGRRASRPERRQRAIIHVVMAVIILLGGRQDEPGAGLDAAHRLAGAVHLETLVGREVNQPVIGARGALQSGEGQVERIDPLAIGRGLMTTLAADRHRCQLVVRLVEPFAVGQQREEIEQDRGGVAHAGQPRAPLAGGVAAPDADHVAGREPDRPGVAAPVAGAGFPGDLFHGIELLPVGLLLGAVEGRERLGGEPEGGVRQEGVVAEPRVADGLDRLSRGGREGGERVDIGRVVTAIVRVIMTEDAGHGGVHSRQVPQRPLGAAQDQGGAIVRFGETEGGHAQLLEQFHEPPGIIVGQHPDERHVERAFDRDVSRYGPIIGAVEILGRESVDVERRVVEQGRREQESLVEHGGVEERLQHAARAAWRGDDVHLLAPPGDAVDRRVADVGEHPPALDLGDDRRQVVDVVGLIVLGIAADNLVGDALQPAVDRALEPLPRSLARQAVEQVRRQVRQGQGLVGQGLHKRQAIRHLGDDALLVQARQEPVAFLAEPLPVATGVDERRRVGQDGQGGAFRPRQVIERPAEITP